MKNVLTTTVVCLILTPSASGSHSYCNLQQRQLHIQHSHGLTKYMYGIQETYGWHIQSQSFMTALSLFQIHLVLAFSIFSHRVLDRQDAN